MASCPWIGTGIFTSPGSPGSGTEGIIAARENLAELMAVDATAVADGTLSYVNSVGDIFIYDATSTLASDGITVVTPTVGPGRWVRTNTGNEAWRRQATWFIEPTTGDDEANGATSGTPLKTHAEIKRRIGPGRPKLTPEGSNVIDVTLLGDLPDTDPIGLDVELYGETTLRYNGTVTSSTTLTGVTVSENINPSGQVVTAITVDQDLSANVGQRIKITPATGDPIYAWILEATGTGPTDLILSAPAQFDSSVIPFTPSLNIVDTLDGSETYVLEELSGAHLGATSVSRGGSFIPGVVMRDITFGANSDALDTPLKLIGLALVACSLEYVLLQNLSGNLLACGMGGTFVHLGEVTMDACGASTNGVELLNTRVQMNNNNVFYRIQLAITDANLRVGQGSSFDLAVFAPSGEDGIKVDPASTVDIHGLVWGMGSGAGYGWNISSGGTVFYDPTQQPTVSGGSGAAIVGGDIRASYGADVPYFNPDNGAALAERT